MKRILLIAIAMVIAALAHSQNQDNPFDEIMYKGNTVNFVISETDPDGIIYEKDFNVVILRSIYKIYCKVGRDSDTYTIIDTPQNGDNLFKCISEKGEDVDVFIYPKRKVIILSSFKGFRAYLHYDKSI